MGKTKDTISWFGNGANEGKEVVKMAGQAIVAVAAVAIVGATIGAVGNMFGGSK